MDDVLKIVIVIGSLVGLAVGAIAGEAAACLRAGRSIINRRDPWI